MKVAQGADVNIPHGTVESNETEIDGSLSLTNQSLLDSERTVVNEDGNFSYRIVDQLEKISFLTEKVFMSKLL